ncbi:hypothetical protein [Goodfellowiella coeruleoviolacea]|uniref:Uncharacterized protein n=1 Tax=Goodfellowiella coeruleoviolacea TaxID=334858 RepID=A0AAE3GFP9_9PSEU|nr:hypothetical protein [Goodfellowiella coeruleoviolacea]MCP2167396.1 hypothetical protein [Goodfellowiella coeruleoviolacea]
MRRSIRAVVTAGALAAAMLVSAPARAASWPVPTPSGPVPPQEAPVAGPRNLDGLAVSVRRDGGSPTGVEVVFDRTSRTATGEKPAPASQFVFLFDKSIRFNPTKFPTCDQASLRAGGPAACPAGSQVGSGRAEVYPATSAEVLVFNTRYRSGLRGVLITIPATGAVLANTFEPVTGCYRADYRWGSDELLPSPLPPLDRAATTRFQVSFGASTTDETGTHSFVESSARPGHPLTFGLWSRFVTGQVALPTATAHLG